MHVPLHRRDMAMVLVQLMSVVPTGYGDKPDQYGWFPLHILANNRDVNGVRHGMIRTLCQHNVRVDVTKNRGQTPLMAAVNTANVAAADELVLQGADVYAVNFENTTVLDMAWHNTRMRQWAARHGVGAGAGVSGEGRLNICVILRRKAR